MKLIKIHLYKHINNHNKYYYILEHDDGNSSFIYGGIGKTCTIIDNKRGTPKYKSVFEKLNELNKKGYQEIIIQNDFEKSLLTKTIDQNNIMNNIFNENSKTKIKSHLKSLNYSQNSSSNTQTNTQTQSEINKRKAEEEKKLKEKQAELEERKKEERRKKVEERKKKIEEEKKKAEKEKKIKEKKKQATSIIYNDLDFIF